MTATVAALAVVNQLIAREEIKRAMMHSALSAEFARAVMRSAEVFRAMGMLPRLVAGGATSATRRWAGWKPLRERPLPSGWRCAGCAISTCP